MWQSGPVRRRGGAVACALVALLASACSSTGDDTVDWYVSSDDFGARTLADTCTDAEVRVHELPADADDAHTALVRRLTADPDSVDLLTVPGSAIPELAAAGLVDTMPDTYADGALPAAVEQVTHDGELYAVPWLFDPLLLWYRSVAAERAGIDVEQPVTWEDLINGADRLGVTVQIGTTLADWVTTMGPDAAEVIELYEDAGVGSGPTNSAVAGFAGSQGGFMIAPASSWSDPALAPLGTEFDVAPYPVSAEEGNPGEGLVLAVTSRTKQVTALIDCLTSDETLGPLVTASGHAPARTALLDDQELDLPTAQVLRQVLPTARTVPVTEHWNAIRRAIDATWQPLSEVTVDGTPAESDAAITAAEQGRLP